MLSIYLFIILKQEFILFPNARNFWKYIVLILEECVSILMGLSRVYIAQLNVKPKFRNKIEHTHWRALTLVLVMDIGLKHATFTELIIIYSIFFFSNIHFVFFMKCIYCCWEFFNSRFSKILIQWLTVQTARLSNN